MKSLSLVVAFILLASLLPCTVSLGSEDESIVNENENENESCCFLIERRRDQVRTEPGYTVVPIPMNIPGLGFSYGFVGSWFNINKTETDFALYNLWGDLAGYGIGFMEVPTGWEPLSFLIFYSDFSKVGYTAFERGMNSDPDETTILELDKWGHQYGQISLKFFEKRLHFYTGMTKMRSRLKSIRTPEGDKITEFDSDVEYSKSMMSGTFIDITDDRSDPRKGVQLEITHMNSLDKNNSFRADQYTMDYNLIGYVPVGKQSTWAFNLYRSDAIVTNPGVVNHDEIKTELGYNCQYATDSAMKSECEKKELKKISETEAANRHGTANGVGGTQRLRSFSTGRFYAAHSLMIGTEFRYNLTEEFTAFDYFVAKGVRTGLQLAFFAESGGVSDIVEDLGKDLETSYGVGFRLIVASGIVARLDLAHGSEGLAPVMVFQYPWMLF